MSPEQATPAPAYSLVPRTRVCAHCQRTVATTPVAHWRHGTVYIFPACPCRVAAEAERAAWVSHATQQQRLAEREAALGDWCLARRTPRLDQLDRQQVALHRDGRHPYDVAAQWLDRVVAAPVMRADPHDRALPPQVLTIIGSADRQPGDLALALGQQAHDQARAVAYIHETLYRDAWTSAPYGATAALTQQIADVPFLVILDAVGQLPADATLQLAWETLTQRLILRGTWLILATSYTASQIERQGSLSPTVASWLRSLSTRDSLIMLAAPPASER